MNDIVKGLDHLISDAYGKYAKYIIQERALPDLRDGLKPVQRRIIYTAYLNKLYYDRPHKKSATLVGDVMGSFHPHGDSSIYDAIVRMCQPWKNNLSLLNMHGNVGSIDGDRAAAYRYTEVRLSKVSELMLDNIDKQCVTFTNNFDDTKKEPTVLPCMFFNLLINGCAGISAGYATSIPPFNPKEVGLTLISLIDNNQLSTNDIINSLPGPDFPTGGLIQVSESLKEWYTTGKGSVKIFASYTTKTNKKMKQIIFTDVPYETNKAQIVKKIDDLIADQCLPQVYEVRDESGRDGISLVIDVHPNADLDPIISYLYKNTDLCVNFSVNLVVIDNKKPVQLSILDLFKRFLVHYKNIVRRGLEYDLRQYENRIHIVLGYIKALKIINMIIALIQSSKSKSDAVDKLISNYDFSQEQSEAIVSLRLHQLTNSDKSELEKEKEDLDNKINHLNNLLNNDQNFDHYLKNKILDFINEFGYERKTKFIDKPINLDTDKNQFITDKNLVGVYIHPNQIKLIPSTNSSLKELITNKLKDTDFFIEFFSVNTKDLLFVVTNLGNCGLILVNDIEIKKLSSNPNAISEYLHLHLHEDVIGLHVLSNKTNWSDQCLVLLTQYGLIKQVNISDLISLRQKRIYPIIKLKDSDTLIGSVVVDNQLSSTLVITKSGYYNHIKVTHIPLGNRSTMGNKAIKLKDNDTCTGLFLVPDMSLYSSYWLIWSTKGVHKIPFDDHQTNKMNLIGKKIPIKKGLTVNKIMLGCENHVLLTRDNDNKINYLLLKDMKTHSGQYKSVSLTNYL